MIYTKEMWGVDIVGRWGGLVRVYGSHPLIPPTPISLAVPEDIPKLRVQE
jgi:hypothetical protein